MIATESLHARAALVLELRRAGVRDIDLLRAFETIPRENFLPHSLRDLAASNCPLPIGCGQTMHSPGVLAEMLAALDVHRHHRVMEIGAGAGYATAILSRLAGEVVGFERFGALANEARTRMERLGIDNASIFHGDGLADPAHFGGFDRVIVHATFTIVPETLVAVLSEGGRLVCGLLANDDERLVIVSQGMVQQLGPCRLGRVLTGSAKIF